MASRTQYVRSADLVSRIIAGETLLVPVRRGVADLACLFSFNGVGSTVWDALEKPRTVDELVDVIEGAYEVTAQIAREDLQIFLNEAQAAGVVQEVESEPANP